MNTLIPICMLSVIIAAIIVVISIILSQITSTRLDCRAFIKYCSNQKTVVKGYLQVSLGEKELYDGIYLPSDKVNTYTYKYTVDGKDYERKIKRLGKNSIEFINMETNIYYKESNPNISLSEYEVSHRYGLIPNFQIVYPLLVSFISVTISYIIYYNSI